MTAQRRPLRLGALISGGGRTLLNIADAIDRGDLDARIAIVIASRRGAPGIERAKARGFDVRLASRADHASDGALHDAITRMLVEAKVDLVCLCGWLRWFRIDEPLRGRVINVHPAILPDFGGRGMYGDRVHAAVLAAGRMESGCTVHFVDEEFDHGPPILVRRCPVRDGDDVRSLAARVFEQECLAYPEAIRMIVEGRIPFPGDFSTPSGPPRVHLR